MDLHGVSVRNKKQIKTIKNILILRKQRFLTNMPQNIFFFLEGFPASFLAKSADQLI